MTTTLPPLEETACLWLGTSSFCPDPALHTLSRIFTTRDGRESVSRPVPACESCTREAVEDVRTLETLDGLVVRPIRESRS